jgi:hypothetical protein
VTLDLVEGPARFTTADAKAWGITQAVGGSNAWRDGAPTTAGPGFTTYHSASGARVINIHRIADLVRGAVVVALLPWSSPMPACSCLTCTTSPATWTDEADLVRPSHALVRAAPPSLS